MNDKIEFPQIHDSGYITEEYLGELINFTVLNKIVIDKECYKFLLPDDFLKDNMSDINIYLVNLFKNTNIKYHFSKCGSNWFLVINE